MKVLALRVPATPNRNQCRQSIGACSPPVCKIPSSTGGTFCCDAFFGIVRWRERFSFGERCFSLAAEDIRGYDFGQMIYYFLLVLLVDNLVSPTDDEWQIAYGNPGGADQQLPFKTDRSHGLPDESLSQRAPSLYSRDNSVVMAIFRVVSSIHRAPARVPHLAAVFCVPGDGWGYQFLIAYSLAMLGVLSSRDFPPSSSFILV